MTGYVIRFAAGGYVGLRENGVLRHVDRPGEARQFESMTAGVIAAEQLGIADYEVEPLEVLA